MWLVAMMLIFAGLALFAPIGSTGVGGRLLLGTLGVCCAVPLFNSYRKATDGAGKLVTGTACSVYLLWVTVAFLSIGLPLFSAWLLYAAIHQVRWWREQAQRRRIESQMSPVAISERADASKQPAFIADDIEWNDNEDGIIESTSHIASRSDKGNTAGHIGRQLDEKHLSQAARETPRVSVSVDNSRDAIPNEVNSNILPPKTQLEEYKIVRQLGTGGFGITYLAFDQNLDGPVAIKEYFYAARRHDDGGVAARSTQQVGDYEWGRARFLDEAQVLSRLNHPNVVRVRRILEGNNTAYIVMDYIEGQPLSAFLEEHGKLTPAEWRPWFEGLLAGLEHVHGADYLHRDIKPDNIMIRADAAGSPQPVLIDFGAARRAAADKTQNLTAVLTPMYAPIEQYSSTSRQGSVTDIYALAAVSYRVLAGEPPPNAVDRVEQDQMLPLAQRLNDPDNALLCAIDSALAVRAADRPQNIGEWRRLIQHPGASHQRRPESRVAHSIS